MCLLFGSGPAAGGVLVVVIVGGVRTIYVLLKNAWFYFWVLMKLVLIFSTAPGWAIESGVVVR